MRGRLLIKGGTVLSLDRGVGNTVGADVLIEDGVIREVGPSLRARNADVVDAADCIIMPGFVDAHRHVWRSITRNLDAASAVDLAAYFTPDDVYAATLVGLLQAVEAGITTVVDWCDVSVDTAHHEAAASAHADAGVERCWSPRPARTPATSPSRRPHLTSSKRNWSRSLRCGPATADNGSTPAPVPPGRPVAKSPSSAGAVCWGLTSRCPTASA